MDINTVLQQNSDEVYLFGHSIHTTSCFTHLPSLIPLPQVFVALPKKRTKTVNALLSLSRIQQKSPHRRLKTKSVLLLTLARNT